METKNSTAKASRNGNDSWAARWLREDHAGEERAESEGNAEQLGRSESHRQGYRENGEAEQLPRAGVCDIVKDPGYQAPAHHQHEADKDADLDEGKQQHAPKTEPEIRRQRVRDRRVTVHAEHACQGRQQHQRNHHREVFHDQPADRDAPAFRFHQTALLDGPEQNHGACYRQGKSEHETGADRPSEEQRNAQPHQGGDGDLDHRAGQRYRAYRQKILEGKVKPNSKHQENDAQLGQAPSPAPDPRRNQA